MNAQNQHQTLPKARSMQSWQRIARRIRVPLGFLVAGVYLVEAARREPHAAAIAWSLALVLPGLALRGYAAGTVEKNRELTVTGPYAYTRNPLYLGSMLMAGGFALALFSWPVALLIGGGFAVVYVPVIAAEERDLRTRFAEFDAYCRRVPRLIPRPRAGRFHHGKELGAESQAGSSGAAGGFSGALYRKHREYNAVLGAALLYLSLLYLRPVVEAIVQRAR